MTWAEARDAFIAENGYQEIPSDAEVFFAMLMAGELDGVLFPVVAP